MVNAHLNYEQVTLQLNTEHAKKVKREVGIPIKSVPSFPLVNLPVGTWLTKSLPYGGKLLLKAESMKLLFPGSTVESPNTYMAETSFLEAPMVATKHDKIKSKKSLE